MMETAIAKADILLVEDDNNLGYLLKENLTAKGFNVTWAATGEEGLSKVGSSLFDLCIFDVMLPELDGFTLASSFRTKYPGRPFVFLTARSLEKDRLTGFELGADDYIPKPFSFKELYYRIQVILRRTRNEETESPERYVIGAMEFYPDRRIVRICDDEKKLSQREAGLLHILLQNKGKYITRSDMLKAVWGNDDYFTGKSMDVYITRIRKLLKPDPGIEIENLYGTGYRIKYISAD